MHADTRVRACTHEWWKNEDRAHPLPVSSYRTDPSLSVRAGPCPVSVIIGTHYIGTDQSPHVRTFAGNYPLSLSLVKSRQVIRIHVKARAHPRASAGPIVPEIRCRKKPGELRGLITMFRNNVLCHAVDCKLFGYKKGVHLRSPSGVMVLRASLWR